LLILLLYSVFLILI